MRKMLPTQLTLATIFGYLALLLELLTAAQDSGCKCHKISTGKGAEVMCECSGSRIVEIPSNLTVGFVELFLDSVAIEVLKNDSFQPYFETIRDLHMKRVRELRSIESGIFHNLNKLRSLNINHAPKLKVISDGVFHGFLPNFRVLSIIHSGLEVVPNMNHLSASSIISTVNFDSNKIKNISSHAFRLNADIVNLDHNMIESVSEYAFNGSRIAKLSLKGNKKLSFISEHAFKGLKELRSLDLSNTSIRQLPTEGLESLEILRLRDTFSLKEFPSVLHFKEIKKAYLTYPYHCCAFRFPAAHHPTEFARQQAHLHGDAHAEFCSETSTTTIRTPHISAQYSNAWEISSLSFANSSASGDVGEDDQDVVYGKILLSPPTPLNESYPSNRWENDFGMWIESERNLFTRAPKTGGDPSVEGTFHVTTASLKNYVVPEVFCGDIAKDYRNVSCEPMPDAFNPCEDVMGYSALRVAVWLVAVAAMLGNLAVIVVLLSSRMSVSKFLMCHLAFADFCMGLYLLIIASVDVHTIGVYFNYAIHWQHGAGCQVAGFLTVFSSELSIFTLTVITLERWYAITYAINLNKRLHLSMAAKIMTCGWIYALTMASLPILGISGYIRTSICLPMENRNVVDFVYIIILLLTNGLAFLLICACYAKMYLSILRQRRAPARSVNSDASVAKRMAMLVFTDFACWAPIVFFGLTAVAGYPLIDVTDSKILLVFFYPLNSCANPFLYAILTKQYRRDLTALLGRYGTRKVFKGTLSTNTPKATSLRVVCRGAVATPFDGSRLGVTFDGEIKKQKHWTDTVKVKRRPKQLSIVSDALQCAVSSEEEEEESSSSMHKGSPHPIKSSFTKLNFPNVEQELILKRVLGEEQEVVDPKQTLLFSTCSSTSVPENNGFTSSSNDTKVTVV